MQAFFKDKARVLRQGQTEAFLRFVLFAQDGRVLVEAVEFLGQIEQVVRDDGRAELVGRLTHRVAVGQQALNQLAFLVGQRYVGRVECKQRLLRRGGRAGRGVELAAERADARVRVLDERAGIAVEVDGFLWIEQHVLDRIHFEQEVFECAQRQRAVKRARFRFGQLGRLAERFGCLAGRAFHLVHQVVGIHHRALARFHLAFGQFHHAVGEVDDFVAPGIAEFFQHPFQHVEMVVLFVAHHVNQPVGLPFLVAQSSRAQVLRHIDRSAVFAQQQFLVQALVAQVGPHRAVFLADEHAVGQAFLHNSLARQIGLRFVIGLVEVDAQAVVSLLETLVNPAVHHVPKVERLLVTGFPQPQHFPRLQHQRRLVFGFVLLDFFSLHDGLGLFGQFLAEHDVVFAHEVVALHAGGGRRFAARKQFPREHGFADMDAAVVDQIDFLDVFAGTFQDFGHRPTQ